MNLVANAVAGAGEVNAVLGGNRLQIAVVIGIFKTGLKHIVVDIRYGKLGMNLGNADGLELKVSHGACRVLSEGLIDADTHFLPRFGCARKEVGVNNLLNQIQSLLAVGCHDCLR